MTWSAPSDRTRSTLAVLQTPVTSAPEALAIWTAKVPTPPDAPMISTCWPGCTFALRTACSAVTRRRDGGRLLEREVRRLGCEHARLDAAYSAKEPSHVPYTSSPGEPGHVGADRLDRAGDARPGLDALGRGRPKPASRIA